MWIYSINSDQSVLRTSERLQGFSLLQTSLFSGSFFIKGPANELGGKFSKLCGKQMRVYYSTLLQC